MKECVVLCWYMVVQDPPVVIASVARPGDRFSTELYSAFTTTGPYIDFVVWPPLLLYKDGPVLVKGTAQGKHSGLPPREITRRRPASSHEYRDNYNYDDSYTRRQNGAKTFDYRMYSNISGLRPSSYQRETDYLSQRNVGSYLQRTVTSSKQYKH